MAKLKEGVSIAPYGTQCKIYQGEVEDKMATFLISKGYATKEQFEELPKKQKENKKQSEE